MNALIAGFGADLRADDGVGVAVARRLAESELPAGVRVAEVGVGGVALVHELLSSCDRLVIVDAVRRGGTPGTVYTLAPALPATVSADDARALADAHFTEPYRALLLARALGRLPHEIHVVGVEVAETDELSFELSPAVARAVAIAARRALELATAVEVG